MIRKLPMFGDLVRKKPTVDAARKKLGGRVKGSEGPAPGRVVEVPTSTGSGEVGVVLFTELGRTDVLFERGVVRRLSELELKTPSSLAPSSLIARLSIAVRRFDAMAEGDAIMITAEDGSGARAVLREKCRFGALVEREDGAILAVGFDRVGPLPKEELSS